jgi:DNA-binding NarL/FixJ family response regulator
MPRLICVSLVFALNAPGFAAEPIDAVRLEVLPRSIRLTGANRRQTVLVTAVTSAGQRIDVTWRAVVRVDNATIAAVAGPANSTATPVLVGKTDGKTALHIRFDRLESRVPITVAGAAKHPPVHFVNDVIPLFSKLGCNSGGCHGKRSGQNGFRLSVFGSDPRADYASLRKAARGRRVFPSAPNESLLIRKATAAIPHGGGRRTAAGSSDHELLAEWIRQGMPWGRDDAPKLARIEVAPRSRVMAPKSPQQLLVTAVYSDGSRRDVTDAADYTSNADVIAEVKHGGLVRTGGNPGEAAITVNYMGQVAAVQVLVPRPNAPSPYPTLPQNNGIDSLVWAKLKKLGIVPSELCDDATFLRRLYIDAIGTLPAEKEVRSFLADKRPDKRRRAIDAVLGRPEFADYWALKFADVLLVNSEKLGERGAYQFHRWLRKQFAENRPYDEWVRELLTASGDTDRNGPANFYKALKTKEDLTRAVSQAFLGIRMDCAQCHHHPFEKWGQDDFFGMAGYFNGLTRKKLSDDRELIYHAGYQPTMIPLVNKPAPTKPPGGPAATNLRDGDPRVQLANWITSPKNPYFARLVANRLWKHYLGRGLVEPEDDLRSTNPATNEPLLRFLSESLIQGERSEIGGRKSAIRNSQSAIRRFDLKALMRLILNSRVYQLSSVSNATNAGDAQNFSHYTVKRLPAEVLLDAVSQVTGSPEKFAGMPAGTRTIHLWDNRLPSYFLDTFGRSERESPCECGKSSAPTMAQALHLMNAPEIEAKISDKRGRVARLINAGKSRKEIVESLCLVALGRFPGEKERRVAAKLFAGHAKPQAGAEDFLWALLNSYEFLFVR